MTRTCTWTIRMGGSGKREGVAMARQLLRDTLPDMFGGFTARHVDGGWRDPDTDVLYVEAVYEITSDIDRATSDEEGEDLLNLRNLCRRCKELTGEQCIYLNQSYGYTDFI